MPANNLATVNLAALDQSSVSIMGTDTQLSFKKNRFNTEANFDGNGS